MAKIQKLLSKLLPKSSSQLETDAAVIPRTSNDQNTSNKNEESATNGTVTSVDNPTSSGISALVPATEATEDQQLQLANPGSLTQNIINNVQNNTLSGPQTSITNTAGMQVLHINNAQNFQIGTSITINLPNEDRKKSTGNGSTPVKWANLKLSDTIRGMMKCEDDLDSAMMDTISRHLGYEWKSFARTLDYSEGQIEAFECDNKPLAEQIYQFVLDWSRNDDKPTLGRMVELLWENKHKETVYRMKLLWKDRRRSAVN